MPDSGQHAPYIKTRLRPDYYEFFPRFTDFELQSRLSFLTPLRATLLDPFNWTRIGYQPELRITAGHVEELLIGCGISSAVSVAIRDALRAAEPHYSTLLDTGWANISRHVPTGPTWISAPGVIALMLQQILPYEPHNVLEIGSGTGIHAVALLNLFPQARLTGVDPARGSAARATQLARSAGVTDRCTFIEDQAQSLEPGGWDLIYCTAAGRAEDLKEAAGLAGRPPALLQAPRPITLDEFDSEPPDSWLRKRFSHHGTYLASDSFREYLALSCYRVDANQDLSLLSSIYDLTFVPLENLEQERI